MSAISCSVWCQVTNWDNVAALTSKKKMFCVTWSKDQSIFKIECSSCYICVCMSHTAVNEILLAMTHVLSSEINGKCDTYHNRTLCLCALCMTGPVQLQSRKGHHRRLVCDSARKDVRCTTHQSFSYFSFWWCVKMCGSNCLRTPNQQASFWAKSGNQCISVLKDYSANWG